MAVDQAIQRLGGVLGLAGQLIQPGQGVLVEAGAGLADGGAGLGQHGAQAFVALIAELRALHGLTAVMVTHELERVAPLLDRVAVLADRRVVAIGPLAAVRRADHPFIQAYFAAHDPQGENHGK